MIHNNVHPFWMGFKSNLIFLSNLKHVAKIWLESGWFPQSEQGKWLLSRVLLWFITDNVGEQSSVYIVYFLWHGISFWSSGKELVRLLHGYGLYIQRHISKACWDLRTEGSQAEMLLLRLPNRYYSQAGSIYSRATNEEGVRTGVIDWEDPIHVYGEGGNWQSTLLSNCIGITMQCC